jgi:hypothetical protein
MAVACVRPAEAVRQGTRLFPYKNHSAKYFKDVVFWISRYPLHPENI